MIPNGHAEVSDDDTEIELVPESYPDTLCDRDVFFYPDLGTLCDQYKLIAVRNLDGHVEVLDKVGGKWAAITDYKPLRGVN